MSEQLESTKYMRDLRRVIVQHFDLEELKAIAFDLSIDWDDLSGETKPTKVQSLIMYLARRGRLSELGTILAEERPHINLPPLPSSVQQIKDEKLVTPDPLLNYIDKMKNISSSSVTDIAKAIALTDEILSKLRQRESKGQLVFVIKYISQHELSQYLRSDLSGINLSDVDLGGVNLQKANLLEANLQWAKLCQANLQETTMRKANLHEADLEGADLSGANLIEANLLGANLQGANLQGANLRAAKLYRANLLGAELQGANLINSDLTNASLEWANLEGADLRGVGLQWANLRWAYYNIATIWPTNFDPKAAGADLQE